MKQYPTPEIKIDDFGPLIHQLKCHPNCKECRGQGWTGLVRLPNGDIKLQKCRYAVWGETDYVLAMRRLDIVNENIGRMRKSLEQEIGILIAMSYHRETNTIIGIIKYIVRRLRRLGPTRAPKEQHQALPSQEGQPSTISPVDKGT